MELKRYQKQVIKELHCYLMKIGELKGHDAAKLAFIAQTSRPYEYAPEIPKVPFVCVQVPTGGGKTLLAAASERVELVTNTSLAGLERIDAGWRLRGADGSELGTAAAVVLAHSHGMLALPQAAHLPLRCFRGQVSHIPALAGEAPHCVVCRDGYVTPPVDGWRCVGASFQRSRDTSVLIDDHVANLARLAGMLPDLAAGVAPETLAGRTGLRPVSPDKLPLLGALPQATGPAESIQEWPRHPGLYVASGYGARGLVWSHLMAEVLASQLCGEPLPIEAELAVAVDPARFAWKGLT